MSSAFESVLACPVPLAHADVVQLAHGGGGTKMATLIERIFLPAFRNEHLAELADGRDRQRRRRAARVHARHVRRRADLLPRRRPPAEHGVGSRSREGIERALILAKGAMRPRGLGARSWAGV
jgi:hypothetical protein